MTDVNLAVGIGRAVVQDELGTILANFAQLLVQANAVPALQDLRFALRQAGFMGKAVSGRLSVAL